MNKPMHHAWTEVLFTKKPACHFCSDDVLYSNTCQVCYCNLIIVFSAFSNMNQCAKLNDGTFFDGTFL